MSAASLRTVASAGLTDDDQGDFPSHFMCPITFDVTARWLSGSLATGSLAFCDWWAGSVTGEVGQVMTDPVVAVDGHTYERGNPLFDTLMYRLCPHAPLCQCISRDRSH